MKASRTNNSVGQEYLVMFRVYVQADGSMVVVIGNQRLEVTQDEIHALLCGTLEFASVFKRLHEQIDTTLVIMNDSNDKVNGHVQG